ncbi:hypothetical protein CEXT_9261 [Caerostris extrusa]|uniref:Uncharacterized protein n=1 Tax=Caerostris extrusa TaxID=172846 RepID=A0AAV4MYE9_CAEEX|nr:hypothetical protein CEXT_9261 [Caerostris extrusa]
MDAPSLEGEGADGFAPLANDPLTLICIRQECTGCSPRGFGWSPGYFRLILDLMESAPLIDEPHTLSTWASRCIYRKGGKYFNYFLLTEKLDGLRVILLYTVLLNIVMPLFPDDNDGSTLPPEEYLIVCNGISKERTRNSI